MYIRFEFVQYQAHILQNTFLKCSAHLEIAINTKYSDIYLAFINNFVSKIVSSIYTLVIKGIKIEQTFSAKAEGRSWGGGGGEKGGRRGQEEARLEEGGGQRVLHLAVHQGLLVGARVLLQVVLAAEAFAAGGAGEGSHP